LLVLTQTSGILKPFAIILGFIMNYIYRFLELLGISNVGLTIILFTLVVNVLIIPLTIKQQRYTKMSSLLNPEIQKIQKKYENRKDERSVRMQQAELQAVYDKYGASPTGGCLPMLIQLPILFALYRVIYNVPAYVEPVREIYMHIAEPIMNAANAGDIMESLIETLNLNVRSFDVTNINKIIDALYAVKTTGWSTVSEAFASNPDVVAAIEAYSKEIININVLPGGLNIADAPVSLGNGISGIFPGVLIPILAGITQWMNIKVSQKNQAKMDLDSQMGSTMNTMNLMMPIMSMFFCVTLPAGMGLYWISSAVFRTIIYLGIDKFFNTKDVEQIIEANKEKAAKKAEKRGEQNEKLEEYASMKTKNIPTKSISQLAGTSVEGKGAKSPSSEKKNSKPVEKDKNAENSKSISGYAHMLKRHDD
jgi:YidC/Oxa1 family membrane protein insertase